jgi:hypothetical protein
MAPVTTNVANPPTGDTHPAKKGWSDTFAAVAGAIVTDLSMSAVAQSRPPTSAAGDARVYVSSKVQETGRQVARVQSLQSDFEAGSAEAKLLSESIASSISILNSLVPMPIPVPIAAGGDSTSTTLFFEDAEFYGDIEISGNEMEYFLKHRFGGAPMETYDVETVELGKIPPRLLARLFSHYANR